MILSMTGYGAGVSSSNNYQVTVELKSLNSKYFDIMIKMPSAYSKYEIKLRNYLAEKLSRGKISASISVEVLSETKRVLNINHALAKSYLQELQLLRQKLNLDPQIDLPFLLSLPEVIPTEITSEDPEEWELIQASFEKACEELLKNRKEEGEALNKDLAARREGIRKALIEIEKLAPTRMENIRERVMQSLEEIRSKVNELDSSRFEQELLYYLERLDINEEIVRLRQHLDYFESLQHEPESKGKQLQFLSQEVGREINTIGAKANDASIQRLVVQMKEELEKIKEQVLNIV